MSKQLDELLEKYAWNNLQIHQLRIADEHRLDLSHFHPKYDWEQLREIRICLQDGFNPAFIEDEHISAESMRSTREAVYEESGFYIKQKELIKAKRQRRLLISVFSIFVLVAVGVVGLWKKDILMSMIGELNIQLTEYKIEIPISKITEFHYLDYVESYTEGSRLILPTEKIDTIGEYQVQFKVENETKKAVASLFVVVYDDIKPVVELKNETISLEYGQNFNPYDYLVSAVDNIDGDIKDKVNVQSNVNILSQGQYTVEYSATDQANNISNTTLNVIVKEQEKQENKTENHKPSSNGSDVNTPKQPISNGYKPIEKSFTIDTYNDFNECLKASQNYIDECIAKGYAGKATAEPIKRDGVYIGYRVIFS